MTKLLKILLIVILLPIAGCSLFWIAGLFLAGTHNLDKIQLPRPPARPAPRR